MPALILRDWGQTGLAMERTQNSTIYDEIRRDILTGRFAAGEWLKTRSLAARFDVGLSPVREALSRLTSEGWVRQSERRGFTVALLSVEELRDLHRARSLMNEVALRESIRLGDESWEEQVLLSLIRLSRHPRPAPSKPADELDRWTELHKAYHSALIGACQSKRLVYYCDHLFDELDRYRRVGVQFGSDRTDANDEHQAIADAAVARDAETAVAMLNRHYARTVQNVERALIALQAQEKGGGQ